MNQPNNVPRRNIPAAGRANSIQITSELFESFLRCETKSFLKLSGLSGVQSDALSWQSRDCQKYRGECLSDLRSKAGREDWICENWSWTEPMRSRFRLFLKCSVVAGRYQSTIDAIERESRRRGDTSCFIPIRYIPGEKITKEDRLLVGFDALVLSELNGKLPLWGKIIYGPRKKIAKVKLAKLLGHVKPLFKLLSDQLSTKTAPPLALNKHCSECEFQLMCREQAVAADDLSLLANMSAKERKKLHEKGIFTIKQLSYTFRPRRRKRTSSTDPRKYYHALKALAIREQKVHIAGGPELDITPTPIFLDVESVPDRDFYYLIGIRTRTGESPSQRSFWADGPQNEESIWNAFLATLRDLPDSQIIHYGSYETQFLKKLRQRYCVSKEQAAFVESLVNRSVNLLSVVYARIYFPTYTNGLKDVAGQIGYRWPGPIKSGFEALLESPNEDVGSCRFRQERDQDIVVIRNRRTQGGIGRLDPAAKSAPKVEFSCRIKSSPEIIEEFIRRRSVWRVIAYLFAVNCAARLLQLRVLAPHSDP